MRVPLLFARDGITIWVGAIGIPVAVAVGIGHWVVICCWSRSFSLSPLDHHHLSLVPRVRRFPFGLLWGGVNAD